MTVKGNFAENVLPRERPAYRFLTKRVEEHVGDNGEGTSAEPQSSTTCIVMQQSQ